MPSDALLHDDPGNLSDTDLEAAISELCAHMNAAEYRLIELVGEWEARGTPDGAGAANVAQWLGFRCGIDSGAAREKVRVGKALRDLPRIRARFASGDLSYSKVRAMTRVATPDNEDLLLAYADTGTASQVEKVVRGYRRMERITDPETILRQRRFRGLSWHFDEDGMLVIKGRFPPEDGALILKAIEGVKERMYREQRYAEGECVAEAAHDQVAPDLDCTSAARRADALLRLVEAGAIHDPAALAGGERTLVVLHVPVAREAAEEPGEAPANSLTTERPEIEDGPVVAAETARRMACDASLVVHGIADNGETVSIGRRSRTVPHWLQRALRRRDGGCRFPGCTRTHHVDAHHIRHWADGGETSLNNLVLLCRTHHRMLHEEGFACVRTTAGHIEFISPDGRVLPRAHALEPGDPRTLLLLNARRGHAITPETGTAGWDGRRVDYSESVCALRIATRGTHELPMPPPRERTGSPHARSDGRFRGNAE